MISSILKHTIVIKRSIKINNAGIISTVWNNFKTLKSSIKYISGNESESSLNQDVSKINVRFQIRFNKNINETDNIEFENNTYNIKYIQHIKEDNTTFLHTTLIK